MTQPVQLPTYFKVNIPNIVLIIFYPASPSSSCCILSSLIPLFPLFIVPNLIPSPNLPFKYLPTRGFPMVKWQSPPASAGDNRRWRFNPWVRKIPWRRKWQPTPVFLPGKSHGQRSLAGYSPWGRQVGHNWATEHTHTHSLTWTVARCIA